MSAALRAEWTKQWSVAGTWWALVATIVAMVGGGAAMAALVHADELARLGVYGAFLGQATVAVWGAAAIGDEYGSGLILITLAAMPRRDILLAAKAIVLGGAVLAAGILAASMSLVAATVIRPDVPEAGAAMHAVLVTAVYLALIALLALGMATASRSTATATTLTLGLLYLPPLLAASIAGPAWQQRIQRLAPMSAGLAPEGHRLASWGGLGIVAGWAAAALVAGRQALRGHDV